LLAEMELLGASGPFKVAVAPRTMRAELVTDFQQGFHGWGAERTAKGEVYVGSYQGNKKHGIGTFRNVRDETTVSAWERDSAVGEGVLLSADHKTAWQLMDGASMAEVIMDEAAIIASRVGLPFPNQWLGPDSHVMYAATRVQAIYRGHAIRDGVNSQASTVAPPSTTGAAVDWVTGMHRPSQF